MSKRSKAARLAEFNAGKEEKEKRRKLGRFMARFADIGKPEFSRDDREQALKAFAGQIGQQAKAMAKAADQAPRVTRGTIEQAIDAAGSIHEGRASVQRERAARDLDWTPVARPNGQRATGFDVTAFNSRDYAAQRAVGTSKGAAKRLAMMAKPE